VESEDKDFIKKKRGKKNIKRCSDQNGKGMVIMAAGAEKNK